MQRPDSVCLAAECLLTLPRKSKHCLKGGALQVLKLKGFSNASVYRLSWLLYYPRHTNSTHLLLMKCRSTMQSNWFCSKNPRGNGFINYPHLTVKSILNRRKLLLLSFSPYPISHFASSSTTATSQLVEAEFWVSHSFTVNNTILRPLHRR